MQSKSRRRSRCVVEAVERRLLLRTVYIDPRSDVAFLEGSSWASAYPSLEYAAPYIHANDEVRVAHGTYKPTSGTSRAVSFAVYSGLVIKGGYAGYTEPNPDARDPSLYPTILSGDIGVPGDNSDNSYHVLFNQAQLAATATVDGFTITGGNSNVVNDSSRDRGGGADAASTKFTNCLFTANSAINGGAAYAGADSAFSGCTFNNNSAGNGGAIYAETTAPSLTNCTFTANTATTAGGAMYSAVGFTISGCTFTENSAPDGGAIAGTGTSQVTINTSTFTRNSATTSGGAMQLNNFSLTINRCMFNGNISGNYGGAIYNTVASGSATLVLLNSSLASNKSSNGGAIFNSTTSAATIVNCDFVSNTATASRAIADAKTASTVNNCIFWDPVKFAGTQFSNLSPIINYSDFQGGWTGGGGHNVDVDPLFARPASAGADGLWSTPDDDYGDLRILAYSPVVDAADNGALAANSAGYSDLSGAFRYRDVVTTPDTGSGVAPQADIGAYEAVPARAATAGGPYVGVQAHDLQLHAYGASTVAGSLQFEWDFDNDGVYDDAVGATPIFPVPTLPPHTLINLAVRVTDSAAVRYTGSTQIEVAPMYLRVDSRATGVHDGSTWADAITSLTSAIDRVLPQQVITVAAGTYKPTAGSDRAASITLHSGLVILGGFAGVGAADPDARDVKAFQTILSGDIGVPGDASDNSIHVVTASSVDSTTILDGLTIADGNANGRRYGGGLYIVGGSPVIRQCTFLHNYGDFGGAVSSLYANPSVIGCTIEGNTGDAGAAIYFVTYAAAVTRFLSTVIVGNQAHSPVFFGTPEHVSFDGCTITANTATAEGGNFVPGTAFTNSIVWGNFQPGGRGQASYSDVQGGASGVGNIDADPLFIRNPSPGADGQWGTADDDYGDLRLQPNSPCIDAGSNALLPTGVTTDIAGNPRIVDVPNVRDYGAVVDMGAYETQTSVNYLFDTPKPTIQVSFGVDINPATLQVGDLTLVNVVSGVPLNLGSGVSVSYDSASRIASWVFASPLPDGDYRATLAAGNVTDTLGAPLPADLIGNAYVLGGDANRDRVVDINDLAILAMNWKGGGKVFSQGDFNYDGKVNSADLGILSMNWQKVPLSPPPAAPDGLKGT